MAARNARSRKERKPKKRSALHDVVACILPILSLGASLAMVVLIYQHVQEKLDIAQEALASSGVEAAASAEVQTEYLGVEDPWISAGTFTVGSEELDAAIKSFCDQHTAAGATVEEAAEATFDAIVESTYVDMLDKPSGPNWVHRAAQQYFSYLKSESKTMPEGDYYEFAAVIALCLRYFGYSDAIAVPVLHGMDNGGQYGAALCLVTNRDGVASVCDPALATDGWMLKRSGYNILIDDIGQDLSTVQGMGLEIQLSPEHQQEAENAAGNDTNGTGAVGTGTGGSATGANGTTSGEYGSSDGYGYGSETDSYEDEYGYGTGTSGTGTTGSSATGGGANGTGITGTGSSGANGSRGSTGYSGSNGTGTSGTGGTGTGAGATGTTGGAANNGTSGSGTYGYDDYGYGNLY
ncbi:MAG: hypothetical protein IKG21_08085 [Atopobiaceae bacterium]|nr:hypothetical protein [Atopobiaceae bacterium]